MMKNSNNRALGDDVIVIQAPVFLPGQALTNRLM